MSWLWAGYVSTGVVGVAGITATFRSGRRQQATALAVADKQVQGQLALAREERKQRRAETAYLALLEDVLAAWAWAGAMVEATMATMNRRSETSPLVPSRQPLPNLYFDPPSNSGALVAYWSPRVRQLVDALRETMRELRSGAIGFETEREYRGSVPEWRGEDAVDKIFDRQSNVNTAIEALRDHISGELNQLHDGSADSTQHLAD